MSIDLSGPSATGLLLPTVKIYDSGLAAVSCLFATASGFCEKPRCTSMSITAAGNGTRDRDPVLDVR